jgi:hypothetical protein
MGIWQWLWYKYLSLDQQTVMMFWGMQFTGIAGWNPTETFSNYSFATWEIESLDRHIQEYTEFEFLAGLANFTIWAIIYTVHYLFVWGPAIYKYCEAHNNDFVVEELNNFNMCSLNWRDLFSRKEAFETSLATWRWTTFGF